MKRVQHVRECMFCHGKTYVLGAEDWTGLDVEAEFCSAARAFGSWDEVDGVGCYRCSRKRWSIRDREATA